MEKQNLINKTRINLIAKYGESKVEKINGMTHRKVNANLDAFEKFQDVLFKFAEQSGFDIENYPAELSAIFEFCETSEYEDIDAITKVLSRKLGTRTVDYKRIHKNKLTKLFEDISEIINDENPFLYRIRVSFESNFKIRYVTGYKRKNLRSPLLN